MDDSHIQYGCGLCAPRTWRNFDASPSVRLQRVPVIGRALRVPGHPAFPPNVEYGDIVTGLRVAPGRAVAVYCSHVLEHLALDDFRAALANTRRLLRDGGVFRLVVPDLREAACRYVNSADPRAAFDFITHSHLGRSSRPHGIMSRLSAAFGSGVHLWMWDYPSLATELQAAGFTAIRQAECGDAEDPRFADVEEPERWVGAVGIECRR